MPVTKDCPYLECIYNPQAKVLAVIGTNKKDAFHWVDRVNDDGAPIRVKAAVAEGQNPNKQQRVTLETYAEYYVEGKEEVENFIQNVAVNASDFDYKKVLDMPDMADPSKSGILEGPGAKGSPLIIT